MPTESATNTGMPPVDWAKSSPVGADEADGVVFVFVDIGAKRRARHVGVDLIADRNDAMADHFQSDRVDFSFDGIVHCSQFAHVSRYYSRQFCDPFN